MTKLHMKLLSTFLLFLLNNFHHTSSQKICPNCGSTQVPYPLSTNPTCGDKDYAIHCDNISHNLFFNALNGSSYHILKIFPSSRKIVLQPSPWLPNTCVTKDFLIEGIKLNQTLPFNITPSNTIFLFNCSPRLLISPLNCTPSSLCHVYLKSSGHMEKSRAQQCTGGLEPCCTFIAGGMPSAYKIRLHSSGCRAFRSILHLDPLKPASQWEEGLEIQWKPPQEPICKTKNDCLGPSKCMRSGQERTFRCVCNKGYFWNYALNVCSKKRESKFSLILKVLCGVVSFLIVVSIVASMSLIRSRKYAKKAKLAKDREDLLKSSNCGKSAKMFSFSELRKATNGFSKDKVLGVGGFGEVYKGRLEDGAIVAVKSAKVGDIKSTEQVLNEVGILLQVNHKNLVRLIGCCVESEQPLMVYEYVSNGTLHDHIHNNCFTFLELETRLKIASQTAAALAYLHSMAQTPIYHRDVKSKNILLDEEYNVKVSDFGLSRLAKPGLSHVSTCAQGTLGYLDPEYYRNYQLTDKSDVYSYGVVLLELVTSQHPIDFSREEDCVNLVVYAMSSGSITEIVDKRLIGTEPSATVTMAVKLLCKLALACLKEKRVDRPSMAEVAQELQNATAMAHQEKGS